MDNAKVYAMPFAKVYGLLVQKAERKGRTRDEVDEATCWLTGYDRAGIARQLERGVDYRTFFEEAPAYNPDADELVRGVVCGVRVEDVGEPLMRKIRQLDKLVDELAKGRPMEKVLRLRG